MIRKLSVGSKFVELRERKRFKECKLTL